MSSLVEIGQVIIKKKTLKVGQFIFAISLLSTLGKGCDPSLNRPESPSPQNALCQVWLKLALWFLKEDENEKSVQTDGLKTDNR